MKKFKKIVLIVMDSLGVGDALDQERFGDLGANTFKHIIESKPDLHYPTLKELGMDYYLDKENYQNKNIKGIITTLSEASNGKDTLTGHFEMMGLISNEPFPSFTDTGFPKELIDKIEAYTKRKVIGNCSASGTEIIKELGEEQIQDGSLIVYTSADSVLQIAAHEEVIPLSELYDICQYVRKITLENSDWKVGRIIARPYLGTNKDNFMRTTNRHDYAVKPDRPTVLNYLMENGYTTYAVGKINDIFDGYGISNFIRTISNEDGMDKTIDYMNNTEFQKGIIFTNLVDFDALYGHRRNAIGYGEAIERFDLKLNKLISSLDDDTLLMITADHGNDPTFKGTDHTREDVPLIMYYNGCQGQIIPIQKSFVQIGATILDNFNLTKYQKDLGLDTLDYKITGFMKYLK